MQQTQVASPRIPAPRPLLLGLLLLLAASQPPPLGVGAADEATPLPCPSPCNCSMMGNLGVGERPLATVDCRGRNLVEFPEGLASDTEALLFSDNNLRNLSHLPALPQLLVLDLNNNRIRRLDNHYIFERMGSLQRLNLGENSLASLQHGSFSGLRNLHWLNLTGNALTTVEIHAFGGLNQLTHLYLSHNRLFELKRIWLLAMSSLQELSAASNLISRLDLGTFNSLDRLQTLDLSDNYLRQIQASALEGLTSLRSLNLSSNRLGQVPGDILQVLPKLQVLALDANNFERISSGDFKNASLRELSVSFQPELRAVDRGAFSNLPQLQTLWLHHNPRLLFLHPHAFLNTPRLSRFFLNDNQLMAVSQEVLTALPALRELHVYGNPLHCDCNIYWIKRTLVAQWITNQTDGFIKEPDKLLCDSPSGKSNLPLSNVSLADLPPVCPPTTLPFFNETTTVSIGDDLVLECQAIGVLQPDILWSLPNGLVLNASSWTAPGAGGGESKLTTLTEVVPVGHGASRPSGQGSNGGGGNYPGEIQYRTGPGTTMDGRVSLEGGAVLRIRHVTQEDSGTYACQAGNLDGYDISSTSVTVSTRDLRLTLETLAPHLITVGLQGSIPRTELSLFQLFYRPDSSQGYHVVHLRSHTMRFTLTGLEAHTTYQVCLRYLSKHVLNCLNVSTPDAQPLQQPGITRVTGAQVGAGVGVTVGLLILLVCIVMLMRRLRKKDYAEPLAEKEAMSQIPLENLYQPPSTPLCSSRTALLPHSQI